MKLAQNFFVMSFLILASGKQIFLLQSAIAENVFILFSIWSLFFLYRFFNQEKDQELFQFLLVASLLPFTRYIGIAFIIGFTCILIVYCFKKKPQRKSSVFFILCILILLWMPINFYLLKNKIIEGSFFGSRDLAVNISLITSLTSRVLTVVSDLSIPILISFIFGFNLVWKKQYKYMIQISLMAFVFYIAIMAFSDTRYMVYDNFPSRTLSPSYPLLLLGVIFLGSWFRSKININAALLKIMLCIVFIFSIQKIIFISKQYTNRNNFVLGAEYSRNIEQFCHNTPATKSYILIQQFSRNHIGQSFKYYCPHIIPIDFEKTILLLKGEFIYSPYNIESQFIMQNKIYYSSDTSKRMYQYKIKADITTNFINIKELLKQLD